MKTILTAEELREGVSRMAGAISREYGDRPLTIVGILTGSIVLLADLIRQLSMPLRIELAQAKSYGAGTTAGALTLNMDMLSSDVRGRDILLVDDIFDTGRTLNALVPRICELGAASVKTAVLLRKAGRTEVAMRPDFVGFDVPDVFVVGYGLDHADMYRNLPYLAALGGEDMKEG